MGAGASIPPMYNGTISESGFYQGCQALENLCKDSRNSKSVVRFCAKVGPYITSLVALKTLDMIFCYTLI